MKLLHPFHGALALAAALISSSLPAGAHVAADEMAAAANQFVASLQPAQKAQAVFELKDAERQNWHFVPKDRKGLTLKDMTADQRTFALGLLASGLSREGYSKATNIMSLESILAELEGPTRRFPRDPQLYHFLVFGKPEPAGTWGWRVEGHHFSANFTVVNGRLFASTPSFMGTNPAEVRKGPRAGVRVLAAEEDLARKLVKSLSAEQRKAAVFLETAPKEIFTEAKPKVQPLDALGVTYSALTADQQKHLMQLVREYVARVRPELAQMDLARIQAAGMEGVRFAWAGGLEKGEGHYYRVQGPTFLLEYDNTQNDNNHVHAVWRDFQYDFGEDLLRKHVRDYHSN